MDHNHPMIKAIAALPKKPLNGKLGLTAGVGSKGKAGLCENKEEDNGPANAQPRSTVQCKLEAASANLSAVESQLELLTGGD
jgi:hypothetical protein